MNFTKMNGAGNDFLIFDGIREKILPEDCPKLAENLCRRHLSIGADGLMLVLPSEKEGCDFRMLFFNSDGTMGEMCGNGARCICRYGYETGLSGEDQTIETTAGIVTGKRIDKRNYRIRLNDPSAVKDLVIESTIGPVEASYVELGNPGIPHAVVDCTKLPMAVTGTLSALHGKEKEPVWDLGRELRYAKEFPKGANVNFYRIIGPDELDELTYERGVEDFTFACGTGTGSVVHVLTQKGLVSGKNVKVHVRGGLLVIDIGTGENAGIYLTGPTNMVARGTVLDEELF